MLGGNLRRWRNLLRVRFAPIRPHLITRTSIADDGKTHSITVDTSMIYIHERKDSEDDNRPQSSKRGEILHIEEIHVNF